MSLMSELQRQMQPRSEEELIDILSQEDEQLRLSQFVDLSSMPESRLLTTEFAALPVVQGELLRRLITPLLLEKMGPARFLDDIQILRALDNGRMLPRVRNLYPQIVQMHERMSEYVASRGSFPSAKRILAFGLGGSAIGAFLSREIIQNQGYRVPLDIHTCYPESFHGIDSDTLVVICSYSGNTEETLYAFDYAARRTKKIVMVSRGGELGRLRDEYPFIEIPESDIQQPRESIGFWVGMFLFMVSSLGLARKDDGSAYRFDLSDIMAIEKRLDEIDRSCAAETPFVENPAKEYATYFLYGTLSGEPSPRIDWKHPRVPVVLLDGADRAIGKRLANQFGESIEHPVTLLVFCEDAHNEIQSVATIMLEEQLAGGIRDWSYIYVSSKPSESPEQSHRESRTTQRIEATLQTLFREHNVDFLRIETDGGSLLERKLCLLKLLDYARTYASILRGSTPLPVPFMDLMKRRTAKIVGVADRRMLKLLTDNRKLPMPLEAALTDETVKSYFPALRHTILKRLIDGGYLAVESGTLSLTEKGKQLVG
jgi:glucose/mannose-6-phosphate isomerase